VQNFTEYHFGPIYHHVVDISADIRDEYINISPRDVFKELLQTHLRSFYKKINIHYESATLNLL